MTALVIILILLTIATYLFIPSRLILTKSININVPLNVASRYISDQSKWQLWWPEKALLYDGYTYSVKDIIFNTVETTIKKNNTVINSAINLRSLKTDSVLIQWEYTVATSLNPVKRILQYRTATRINNNSEALLQSFRKFIEKKENIYGMNITEASTVDTILVSTKKTFPGTPNTAGIYLLIKDLQDYIGLQHAKQTGSPMLNITKSDSAGMQVMVAVPTDKILPGNARINYKIMIPGNFMIAEVKGGAYTVSRALNQLQLYTDDYSRTVMAIPFEVLVTDRMKEPDTLKWITKLYIPVE